MNEDIVKEIKNGGVGVIPTDTIYGIVASALDQKAVEKIYKFKKRDPKKPPVVLIGSMDQVSIFNPNLSDDVKNILKRVWPGPVSVIIDAPSEKFKHLTGGTGTVSLRLGDDPDFRDFLKKTGPLASSSANIEGGKPAETLDEAWETFPELDFYFDGGTISSVPSTLVSIKEGKLKVERQGKWQVPEDLL